MADEENEFYEYMSGEYVELSSADEEQVADAIVRLFDETMKEMALPGTTDEEDQEVMSGAIRGLMRQCFIGGVTHQYVIGGSSPGEDSGTVVPVGLTPDMAVEIVLGLMKDDGISLKLVVDRGHE